MFAFLKLIVLSGWHCNFSTQCRYKLISGKFPFTDKSDDESARVRRSADCFGNRRSRRANCPGVKDPPPTPPPKMLFDNSSLIYDPKTDINFTMKINSFGCLYWDDKREIWTTEGCKVGQRLLDRINMALLERDH